MSLILLYFLLALTASACSVSPSVTVLRPLDDQLPNIARVSIPYTWSFLPDTFCSSDGSLKYTTSALPAWLTFDPDERTFHGTPGTGDVGYPDITVTAHGASSSTSSRFSLCVTDAPPPTLNLPLAQQFHPDSPALSSIFFLQAGSAINTPTPTLRVPGKWSFSVGLESDTYVLPDGRDVYYELRLANGSDIPDYLTFDSKTVTLDGVIPAPEELSQPLSLELTLHASDQEGYTAATSPFTLVLADHELSSNKDSLPTINITSANDFIVSLLSPADFKGILVDGEDIQPSNISSLVVDVSGHSWLHYDIPSRTLSGTPSNISDTNPVLPVNLTTFFNQSLQTHVSLALVEPYFVLPVLPALNVSRGDDVIFTLKYWFSSTADPGYNETTITVSYSPITAANFLRYDPDSTNVTGTIPSDYSSSTVDHITLTFTAYSHVSHSTSHTNLDVYVPGMKSNQSSSPMYPVGLATEAHRRLVLGLVLTFGIIGGLCVLTGIFAIVRRCSRVPDTAVLGEEGRIAWSEKDRRWYGLTLSPRGTRVIERSDKIFATQDAHNLAPSGNVPDGLPAPSPLGLGLHRVSERSQQEGQEGYVPPQRNAYPVDTGAVMSKKEFLARIKDTVRQVSDKYGSRRQRTPPRPLPTAAQLVIGKPILVASTRPMDITPAGATVVDDDSMLPLSRPASTFITGSPSGSTAEHSIPRRRADFLPPKSNAQVHFGDGLLVRQPSTGSMGGTSFQSGISGEGESVAEVAMGPHTKPRLVPFTNSTRVPVPMPQLVGMGPSLEQGGFAGNRIASQRAKVCKVDSHDPGVTIEMSAPPSVKRSSTGDELTMGMHYVRALGADQLTVQRPAVYAANGSPATSNLRSSFTSLESSGRSGGEDGAMKVLLRAGERFKFRVPVPMRAGGAAKGKVYYVKQTSGQILPKFVQPDLSGITTKGTLELSGVPTFRDIGEMTVGVYENDGTCVASVIIEVVGKR